MGWCWGGAVFRSFVFVGVQVLFVGCMLQACVRGAPGCGGGMVGWVYVCGAVQRVACWALIAWQPYCVWLGFVACIASCVASELVDNCRYSFNFLLGRGRELRRIALEGQGESVLAVRFGAPCCALPCAGRRWGSV